MKYIDLERQYEEIKSGVKRRILEVLDTQTYIMGPVVTELEERLAAYTGRKFCLTCGSGTEALQIPLMAFGLTREDAVFVPSFTFFASAESICLAGGTPVFVDIDHSFNMDAESLEKEIKRVIFQKKLRPKGIIAVDLFGRSADYDKIQMLAEKYHLFLLEDAAQGFGGSLHQKKNGSFGHVSATSFFPAKPLGCYGDGGAIFTDDEVFYNIMRSIRVHGQGMDKYNNVRVGINGRMDSIQAAVILEKLTIFDKELEQRQEIASWYEEYLQGYFELPETEREYVSAWAQYTIRCKKENQRDLLVSEMKKRDIPLMVYYPIPLHEQTAFKNMGYGEENLPYSSQAARQVFSVPMHPYLRKAEVQKICDALKETAGRSGVAF